MSQFIRWNSKHQLMSLFKASGVTLRLPNNIHRFLNTKQQWVTFLDGSSIPRARRKGCFFSSTGGPVIFFSSAGGLPWVKSMPSCTKSSVPPKEDLDLLLITRISFTAGDCIPFSPDPPPPPGLAVELATDFPAPLLPLSGEATSCFPRLPGRVAEEEGGWRWLVVVFEGVVVFLSLEPGEGFPILFRHEGMLHRYVSNCYKLASKPPGLLVATCSCSPRVWVGRVLRAAASITSHSQFLSEESLLSNWYSSGECP